MFRIANEASRIPAILQNGTKENVIFQLTLAVTIIGVMSAKDAYDSRQLKKKYAPED